MLSAHKRFSWKQGEVTKPDLIFFRCVFEHSIGREALVLYRSGERGLQQACFLTAWRGGRKKGRIFGIQFPPRLGEEEKHLKLSSPPLAMLEKYLE